mmetsp:Transcript_317/g.382  ORF Transcript_317/g.382 Transcript_317/m.382 type:complete len:674 (+) Transcript_317:328-2349(+)|eukprot:CAMPEP_0184023188 /NCGR_PEP_ID=MMETSP0954-20121128/11183_1 /TAXON_ID=627963 /ORGANISM="Aplanochytrium sp, Strain PBS07" /LENGTH=673 /DNA_ID=CAMNT_0026305967 /DNA_START=385 /DNA_END=2406 /DNA_ORIENTATION=-
MVNKIALFGALICTVGAVMSLGLVFTKEFVEVFVADGNGGLSCVIGNIGVYDSSFDPSCLSVEELQASGLGGVDAGTGEKIISIAAFESETTEFKLLFPTQVEFYYELNPFYSSFLECVASGESPACTEAIRQATYPTFAEADNDCDQFWGQLKTTQPAAFAAGQAQVDQLLFPAFAALPVAAILDPWYAQTTVGGTVLVFAGILEGFLQEASLLTVDFNTLDQAAIESIFTTVSGTPEAAIAAAVGSAAAEAILKIAVPLTAAPFSAGCVGLTASECVGAVLFEGSPLPTHSENFLTETFAATYCDVIGNVSSSTCTVDEWLSNAISIVSPSATLSQDAANLVAGLQGIFALVLLYSTGTMTDGLSAPVVVLNAPALSAGNFFDPSLNNSIAFQTATVTAFAVETSNFAYPLDKDDEFSMCLFLFYVGAYGETVPTTCSFEFFILEAGNAAAAAGAPADLISLAVPLVGLFETCFSLIDIQAGVPTLNIPDLDECWTFFAAATVNLAFINGFPESLTLYTDTNQGSPTFDAAAEECKNDFKDIEAIEAAQGLAPSGIAFQGLAFLLAFAAVLTNRKALATAAGMCSILGAVLILTALLKVYNAPVYAVVGGSDDAPNGDIVYLSGRTVRMTLAGVALGLVGGLSMIVSIRTMSSLDTSEVKALEPTKKDVSV